MADDASPTPRKSATAAPAAPSPRAGAADSPMYADLVKMQLSMPDVAKTKTAKVRGTTKAGKDYEMTYKYADISDVLAVIRPHAAKHNFAIVQTTMLHDGVVCLTTTLHHVSGVWIDSEVYPVALVRDTIDPQKIGAALTYARRYQLCALIGVSPDEDVDGAGAETHEEKITREQLMDLQDAFAATGRDVMRFCKAYQIRALPELPARLFDEALAKASTPKPQEKPHDPAE
jgi:ERF superfamily